MRRQIATFLITTSVIAWGVWCGGQYFNEARVIPKLLSNPPESVIVYNQIPTKGNLPFFFPLNPLIFLLSLAAAIMAWKWARASRKWLVLTVLIGFVVSLVLILYLAPLIGSISSDERTASAADIITRAEDWRFGNRIRLIVEFSGFVCSIMALYVWASETNSDKSSLFQ